MIYVVNKRFCDQGVYIGRPSKLGNPYSHLESSVAEFRVKTREESIEKYGGWLRGQYRLKGDVYDTLMRLVDVYEKTGELTLVCWCKPLPCHGDVIRDAINGIVQGRGIISANNARRGQQNQDGER